MNTPAPSQFLLLFRGPEWDKGMSPAEIQDVLDQAMAWFDRLNRRGIVRGTHALQRSGCIVSDQRAQMVTDGPFAESKEAIGGYLLLELASLDEAIAAAKGYPGLNRGITIEVRPISTECPIANRLRQEQEAVAVA